MPDLTMYRGDTLKLDLAVTLDGNPYSLSLCSLWFTGKSQYTDPDISAIFQKTIGSGITIVGDPAQGLALIELAPADTLALASIKTLLVWDCQLKDSNSKIYTIALGNLIRSPGCYSFNDLIIMATASQILDQAIRRLNELTVGAPKHWSRPELLVFLNDAIHEMNLIAGDIQALLSVVINDVDNVYDLAAGTIAPLSIRISDRYLLRSLVADLDNEAQWEKADQKRLKVKVWCPLGLTKIVIWPRPLSADTAYVESLIMHVDVLDAAIPLPVRSEYERAIEDFIVARAMFKEGGAEFEQANLFYARFLDTVQQLSGRNILRRYPAWEIIDTKTSHVTLREGAEPGSQTA